MNYPIGRCFIGSELFLSGKKPRLSKSISRETLLLPEHNNYPSIFDNGAACLINRGIRRDKLGDQEYLRCLEILRKRYEVQEVTHKLKHAKEFACESQSPAQKIRNGFVLRGVIALAAEFHRLEASARNLQKTERFLPAR